MDPVIRRDTREHYSSVSLGDPSVTPSVDRMNYQRLPYDDAATTDQMATDCAAVDQALHLTDQRHLGAHTHPVGEGDYDTVVVSDDLAAVAAGLELHFD
jgi:hypothetical protein